MPLPAPGHEQGVGADSGHVQPAYDPSVDPTIWDTLSHLWSDYSTSAAAGFQAQTNRLADPGMTLMDVDMAAAAAGPLEDPMDHSFMDIPPYLPGSLQAIAPNLGSSPPLQATGASAIGVPQPHLSSSLQQTREGAEKPAQPWMTTAETYERSMDGARQPLPYRTPDRNDQSLIEFDWRRIQAAIIGVLDGPMYPADGPTRAQFQIFRELLDVSVLHKSYQAFFDNAHERWPFVHATFAGYSVWHLALAIAVIGHMDTESEMDSRRLVNSLGELLVSQVGVTLDLEKATSKISLALYQVAALSLGETASNKVLATAHDLLFLATVSGARRPMGTRHPEESNDAWHEWIHEQATIRLNVYLWHLYALFKGALWPKQRLLLSSFNPILPEDDKLWKARNRHDWERKAPSVLRVQMDLRQMLRAVLLRRDEMKVPGEYIIQLLVAAILEHFETSCNPSVFETLDMIPPVDQLQSSDTDQNKVLLTWNRWRNTSCDVLDMIHFAANRTAALNSGVEHATIAHLHNARIILLSPVEEMLRRLRISGENSVRDIRKTMIKWVRHDRYKARLAVIHSGANLWHFRRFRVRAPHEPLFLLHALVCLWVYSAACQAVRKWGEKLPISSTASSPNQAPEDGLITEIIRLDRPCDDEQVQEWVRHGDTFRAYVDNAGDILAPGGPAKILDMGRGLCRTMQPSCQFEPLLAWLDALPQVQLEDCSPEE